MTKTRPWNQIPQRARGWCLTLNNWTSTQWYHLVCKLKYDYMIIGYEVAPTTGTKHLQVYLYVRNKASKTTLKSMFPTAHIEDARGTSEENIKYCSKDGIYTEHGKVPEPGKPGKRNPSGKPCQGERNDLNDVKHMLDNGATMLDVATNEFDSFCRYHRSFQKYLELKYVHRNRAPQIIWIFGPSGAGKTRFAVNIAPDSFYMKPATKWWDGYTQQKVIVIDDFDGSWPFRDFLKLLDWYPYIGQTKFGTIPINSPVIVVTCDRTMEEVFEGVRDVDEKAVSQLLRRVKDFGKYIKISPDGSIEPWLGEPTDARELTPVVPGEI